MFFGRGAVMAKALGTTAAEEHRLGLSKLASVSFELIFTVSFIYHLFPRLYPANKRPSRVILH